jgi:hypothetical protein
VEEKISVKLSTDRKMNLLLKRDFLLYQSLFWTSKSTLNIRAAEFLAPWVISTGLRLHLLDPSHGASFSKYILRTHYVSGPMLKVMEDPNVVL